MEEEMVREETGGDFVEVNMNTYKLTVDAKTGNPVIMLDGLSALGDKQNFFQTTEGYIVIGKPMLRAEIKFARIVLKLLIMKGKLNWKLIEI